MCICVNVYASVCVCVCVCLLMESFSEMEGNRLDESNFPISLFPTNFSFNLTIFEFQVKNRMSTENIKLYAKQNLQ